MNQLLDSFPLEVSIEINFTGFEGGQGGSYMNGSGDTSHT